MTLIFTGEVGVKWELERKRRPDTEETEEEGSEDNLRRKEGGGR